MLTASDELTSQIPVSLYPYNPRSLCEPSAFPGQGNPALTCSRQCKPTVCVWGGGALQGHASWLLTRDEGWLDFTVGNTV